MFRRCAYRKIDQLTPIVSGTEQIRNCGNSLLKQQIEGDKDLFGDGSLVASSAPRHTGHQSLLVHLEKTGYVVLSGDVVHFQSNWDHWRGPNLSYDKAQSAASMEKIARVLEEKRAQLWINHDKSSSDARRHAPEFYY